ncbi:MAG: sulfatase-like hydrolase/transferase [Cyclobacteriaceae bacterium]
MRLLYSAIVKSFMLCLCISYATYGQDKPNIVLIFPDNLGIGEVSSYGGVRGVQTTNIDQIGTEGIRLNNFNVEYSCAISRIALLTGRYGVRTGQANAKSGMTLWEKTIPEALKEAGYATALFGKWHLGSENWRGNREPTHQGFDEWWGIPGTSTPAQYTSQEGFDSTRTNTPYIWEGKQGTTAKKVKPYNMETRRTIDREAAMKGVEFMQKNAQNDQPFFLFYPMTQIHFPTLAHPEIAGTTGAGDIADAMADVDYNVGLLLAEIERLKIEENTLVIWCTDNGGEIRRPWRGTSGPWRGYYNSAMEGGIRTPFVAKWPGRIKPGQVSNEIVHEVDILPTLLAAAGVPEYRPDDRAIDGVNQLPFLEGKQERSNRESLIHVAREGNIMAVKWHNWKLWYYFRTQEDYDPDNLVQLFDLNVDPQETTDVKDFYPWVITIMDSIVANYEASLIEHPRLPLFAKDPYQPQPRGSGDPVVTYERSDRKKLGSRREALPNPDFSGSWKADLPRPQASRKVINVLPMPSLGSGWGNEISVRHADNELEVERVIFARRTFQAPFRYRFALDGSTTENNVLTGRTWPAPTSTTKWDGDRLVITSTFPFQHPQTREWLSGKMIQTMWLQYADRSPWEPNLIVETTRVGVLGGSSSTNRTTYYKGYY